MFNSHGKARRQRAQKGGTETDETDPLGEPPIAARPSVRGKFLFLGDRKLYLRAVTYGPFRPSPTAPYGWERATVERDFAQMRAVRANTVRLYDVPPRWLLDAAERHGLLVMVGLPWEQHVTFLDDPERAASIVERVRLGVRACAGHPAVLCYVVGNEIPAPVVRWHGRRTIERFIERLYRTAKEADPGALATYVNYPTTEYLRLPFLDFVCFNVYLERQPALDAYLARLHNINEERPLVMTELGLDSRRNGEEAQAGSLAWQIRTAFAAGCAGVTVFAWTDEWHRGGHDIEDWDFGLVARDRRPKPALAAVRQAFEDVPFSPERLWPRISVVVCTHNGASTLDECLSGVAQLRYPDYETIVVSDGSSDASAALAASHDVRLVEVPRGGLARARNAGIQAATGEIVAFLDDDASPDPDWLLYLADSFMTGDAVGVGGPNLPFPDDERFAHCVAHAPGGPTHVLLSDREAEHIPGCNMAFRRSLLGALGGFDPQFDAAGDDVDICWRLRERGHELAFNPAAIVWHHRRNSIRGYWKQQRGYGRAESLLERKWPEHYSAGGHVTWGGRLYGNGGAKRRGGRRWRVYYGTWGTGLFQSVYERRGGLLQTLPLMPEWYLVLAALAVLSAGGALWRPLLLFLGPLVLALGVFLAEVVLGAARAYFPRVLPWHERLRLRALTALLYLTQPVARLRGRLAHGLTPWRRRGGRRRGGRRFAVPRPGRGELWSERWQPSHERLHALESELSLPGGVVNRGGDFDRWDLDVRTGTLASARLRLVVEEHGGGRQLARFRWWPRFNLLILALAGVLGALAAGAALDGAQLAAALLAGGGLLPLCRMLLDAGSATALAAAAVQSLTSDRPLATVEPLPLPEVTSEGPPGIIRRGR